ncbi:hypothetical protein Tco_0158707 [Tanacetum coccineum]
MVKNIKVLIKLKLNVLTVIEEAIFPGNVKHQEINGAGIEIQDQDEQLSLLSMGYTSNSSGSDLRAYQLGLESVEAQLVVHQKNEVVYEENIAVLEFEVKAIKRIGMILFLGLTTNKLVLLIPVSTAKLYVNLGNPQQALKYKGMFDSGCSRHMTGNKALLTDYQDMMGFCCLWGNYLDGGSQLGKFDGKAVGKGYSWVSYNLAHEFFKGQGPNWLFDIDSLTNSMNYQPVSAGNQTNKNAGPQETNGNTCLKKNVDVGQTEEENVSTQQYIKDYSRTSKRFEQVSYDMPWTELFSIDVGSVKEATGVINAARKDLILLVHLGLLVLLDQQVDHHLFLLVDLFRIDVANLPHDPLMPGIWRILLKISNLGAEADFNNMEPSTVVSPIPTTRVHSTHPKAQIIGDPKSAIQTRGMTKKNFREHTMISYIQKQRRTNHKDFQNYLFACFLSQHELTKISQALDDESWVEAMQEEQLQFKI